MFASCTRSEGIEPLTSSLSAKRHPSPRNDQENGCPTRQPFLFASIIQTYTTGRMPR